MPTTSPDNLRYPVDTDLPDVPKDMKNLADDVQAALANRPTLAQSSWSTYNPAISGAVSPGNGATTGRYVKLGTTIIFRATFQFGSTLTFNPGVEPVTLTLPYPCLYMGALHVIFVDTPNVYRWGAGYILSSSANVFAFPSAGGVVAPITATTPFTWAAGDQIGISGVYETS